MPSIIGLEGADPRTLENFYKTAVQATLLFSADSWVMSPRTWRTLGGFHHRVAHLLVKMQPHRTEEVRWIYHPLYEAMETVGTENLETYFILRQNPVAHYIATQPILELCLAAERHPGVQVSMGWWEQAGLELGQGGLKTETDTEMYI